jgi:hypothetical protein
MFLDSELLFSNAQAVTATAASTNILDLGAAKDLGAGEPLDLFIQASTVPTDDSGSDLTLNVALQIDSDAAFGSATTVWSRTFTMAELVAMVPTAGGMLSYVPGVFPWGSKERYARLYYTVANGTLGGGTYTAGLCKGKPANAGVTG